MTTYRFTLDNIQMTLDTENGTLFCDNPEMEEWIKKQILVGDEYVLWGSYHPLDAILITNPYRDIKQFSACLFKLIDEKQLASAFPFPEALCPYAPCYAPLYEDMKPCNIFAPEEVDFYHAEMKRIDEEMKALGVIVCY